MERRALTKLVNQSCPSAILCQRYINFYSCMNQRNTTLNQLESGDQQTEVPKKCVEKKSILKDLYKENEYKKKTYGIKYNQFPKISSDTLFFTNVNLPSVKQKINSLKYNSLLSLNFSTSTKHNNFWNKLLPSEKSTQIPMKLFTHKAEVPSLVSEGIGWAGQPIVKRIHPILPEVYGDVSDILISSKLLPTSTLITHQNSLQLDKLPESNDQLENIGQFHESDSKKSLVKNTDEIKQSSLDLELPLPIEIYARNHDSIHNINKEKKGKLNSFVRYTVTSKTPSNVKRVINKPKGKPTQQKIIMGTGMVKKSILHLKKGENIILKSGVAVKKSKKKIRKMTKVCNSKSNLELNFIKTKIPKKKKSKVKACAFNKKSKLEPHLLLSQRINTQSFPKNLLLIENRPFKTYTVSYSPRKFDMDGKENSSKGTKNKNKKSNKNASVKGFFEDDCECPETFIVKGKKKRTKICGIAQGTGEENKKKKWKGKMCQIVPKVKYRQRTFVCASKNSVKTGRKRQLPKCVKPEKREVPRVTICPPISLTDTLQKKSKLCVKPVEEIKVRKRTKVCKPIIILGKEVTEIKTEKAAVCITGLKKKRSRHAKICAAPQDTKNKMQLKN